VGWGVAIDEEWRRRLVGPKCACARIASFSAGGRVRGGRGFCGIHAALNKAGSKKKRVWRLEEFRVPPSQLLEVWLMQLILVNLLENLQQGCRCMTGEFPASKNTPIHRVSVSKERSGIQGLLFRC